MVDTVDHFRREFPLAEVCLLVGQDALATLPLWREPERLLSLVQLVVFGRTGVPSNTVAVSEPTEKASDAVRAGLASARQLTTRRVDVSSTEIRARVREGRSIKGFVPDVVAAYIASAALYRGELLSEVVSVRA